MSKAWAIGSGPGSKGSAGTAQHLTRFLGLSQGSLKVGCEGGLRRWSPPEGDRDDTARRSQELRELRADRASGRRARRPDGARRRGRARRTPEPRARERQLGTARPARRAEPTAAADANPGNRRLNAVPAPALSAEQLPPCAFAIASTIASPSPAPPSARDRAVSARANRSKIRSLSPGGSP